MQRLESKFSFGEKMQGNNFRELFRRYEHNPILTADAWPYPSNSVFNPGATLLPDGETLLLARVEDRRGISHLTAARSQDGITNWRIDQRPTLRPDPENYPEELWGIEDPRITWAPELDRYAVTYTSYSTSGPLVSLALTRDFREFERKGVIMPPEDKDAALLPRRLGGRCALIHRPVSSFPGSRENMWLSYSTDLKRWGEHTVMLEARHGAWWDANKIGLSPQPVETAEGWLVIYHGVRMTPAGCLYRLGLALFDLEDPAKLVRRGGHLDRDGDGRCGRIARLVEEGAAIIGGHHACGNARSNLVARAATTLRAVGARRFAPHRGTGLARR